MNTREAHTEYLLRFLCFQLGIAQRHAVQSYDLAPNLTSNEGNDAYTRLDSEDGARGLYNDNPLLAAAVRTHLARPGSSHVLFGERAAMMAGVVFSTLKVPLPLLNAHFDISPCLVSSLASSCLRYPNIAISLPRRFSPRLILVPGCSRMLSSAFASRRAGTVTLLRIFCLIAARMYLLSTVLLFTYLMFRASLMQHRVPAPERAVT